MGSMLEDITMGKAERAFSAVFGLFLLGVGIYALLFSPAPVLWRLGGGAVLALLGGNLIHAALRCRPSWLSRIGPLP